MEGHPYPGRLSESEIQIMVDMSAQNAKSRDILAELEKRDPNNVSTIRTIYNARKKHKTSERSGQSQMQVVFSFLNDQEYFFDYQANHATNELEDLFFAHPGSLDQLRAFPHLLLMDVTYQTNRYGLPLLEIVGVTSTSQTFCITFAYLHSEKEPSYTWALECLRSAMHGCTNPRVIVTDRELGLMKACAQVFPEASKLLCRWHIYQSILTKCKPSMQDNSVWNAFYRMWTTAIESKNESAYMSNMARLQVVLHKFPTVMKYLKDVWLTPYKEMFVSAWTDRYPHFGNHTTNRVESQHAKLKRYLCSSQSDLERSMSWIHQVIFSQDIVIKASIERSRTIIQHRFNMPHLRDLCGFVSIEVLNLMLIEFERSKDVGQITYKCGCHLRRSYGLPCAHEQAMYVSEGHTIPLDAIDKFWRKLDLMQCQSIEEDDIDCNADVQMFTEHFKQQPRHVKVSWLRILREIFRSSTTSLREPTVKTNTRGRLSTKKKVATNTRNNPTAYIIDGSDFVQPREPHRHSSSSGRPESKSF
ncbi:PKS-NRPS hybrid synthetase CHGG_01239-like [Tripterygium wilfordii]|uniref:PKS-NRPS hybrid synthetase CHGG_01239-like n=1 Tax=Tripterygium wilfordii TaxID=458696 RepID=UPI0018F85621|nr:PKS-NRPS hybrid synthetase CHGG_01239-like [Tripterygium wilfordii]